MSYIARHITTPDERIIYMTRLHWITALPGLAWLVTLGGAGYGLDLLLGRYIDAYGTMVPFPVMGYALVNPLVWMPRLFVIGGVFIALLYLLRLVGTEIALTNQRLIHKSGLVFVQVEDLDLAEIHAEKVQNGLLGRFLDYGSLHFDCRFVGDVTLPPVTRPYRLLKAIHHCRGRNAHPDPLSA